ncbi:MAG: TonB-dependent receptor [Wenzhouxiangella sp.]|jgi:iron complex outermembrane receptor protein|nr:TonB-dependent receptor [Wenzhouxiangella sp.]
MNFWFLRLSLCLLIALCAASHAAQATPEQSSAAADPDRDVPAEDRLSVTITRIDRALLDAPAAVSRVSERELQTARQQLQMDEVLGRVPGLFFQNRYNFAQNQRLAIRGFGARSPFGIRGIRLLVDGFPETLPDGQAQVDGIDLESVTDAEVLRGPSSALHGNASGGVISFRTEDGRGLAPEAEFRATLGSYGFQRLGVRAGGDFDDWNAYLSAWDLRYDGYREQSRTEKRLLNAHLGRQLGPDRRVELVLTALDQPRGEDPSALTRAQAEANRRGAGGQAVQVDARQVVDQYRLGLRFEDRAAMGGLVRAYAFVAARDFFQQLPSSFFPSLIEFDRNFFGAGSQYVGDLALGGFPARYTIGLDLARQDDDRRRFTVSPAGLPRSQTQNELQRADNLGLFAQLDTSLSERWSALLGLRHDRVNLDIDDRLGDRSGSGRRAFDESSWTAGLSYRLRPDRQLYVNAGNAFETPTFTEIKDAAGGVGFSRDLDPQRARNLEFGFRARWGEHSSFDAALFRVTTRDEIVIVASEDGLNLFENAGRTRRDGIELAFERRLGSGLTFSAAYTWSRFRFERFRDGEERFDGNRMPGLPEHLLFAELAWRGEQGAYAIIDTLVMSDVYADNANRERVAGYGLVNARLGRQLDLGRQRLEVFVALNNLTDRHYFSNVRVNAARGAYYEPAPERNVFGGFRLRF